ncbi:MAG: hypothetical protein WAW59_04800 [Patescibacteria group bacterium]
MATRQYGLSMGQSLPYILDELSIEPKMLSGKQIGNKNNNMVNYDAYATTFSNSRKNLHW